MRGGKNRNENDRENWDLQSTQSTFSNNEELNRSQDYKATRKKRPSLAEQLLVKEVTVIYQLKDEEELEKLREQFCSKENSAEFFEVLMKGINEWKQTFKPLHMEPRVGRNKGKYYMQRHCTTGIRSKLK